MFVKVKYFGFYPLGSDVELNNVKIMREHWNEYNKVIFPIGRKNVVSPLGQQVYYVNSNTKIIFFVAIEYGLGHYHIFSFSNRATDKMRKNVGINNDYNPLAVSICKSGNYVKVYERIICGARDKNWKCPDSFFILVETKITKDYNLYTFTNDGNDRFYLEVYNPELIEISDNYISIGKAEKVIWKYETEIDGLQIIERRLINNYIENKYIYENQERITYYR